uniref:Uncharacterized protein n=1 Tax=Caenorhabditis tropicalis TaxID=1561998 RepID=A0A1I7T740_9PELO
MSHGDLLFQNEVLVGILTCRFRSHTYFRKIEALEILICELNGICGGTSFVKSESTRAPTGSSIGSFTIERTSHKATRTSAGTLLGSTTTENSITKFTGASTGTSSYFSALESSASNPTTTSYGTPFNSTSTESISDKTSTEHSATSPTPTKLKTRYVPKSAIPAQPPNNTIQDDFYVEYEEYSGVKRQEPALSMPGLSESSSSLTTPIVVSSEKSEKAKQPKKILTTEEEYEEWQKEWERPDEFDHDLYRSLDLRSGSIKNGIFLYSF